MFRAFKEKFVDKVFKERPPDNKNAEYYDCTFHKLGGASLPHCSFLGCKFAMTDPKDIIGLTITMDCFTFSGVELSPEVFDMLLLLICKTSGNARKRLRIIEDVIGHDRSVQLLKELARVER